MVKETEKWAFSLDNEYYVSGTYDSFEEALADGIKDAKAEGYNRVYVGRVMEFIPRVDADNVIDNIAQDAYDEAGECSLDYLENVSLAQRQKLEEMLTETFNKWAKETNNEPRFFTVEETSEHEVSQYSSLNTEGLQNMRMPEWGHSKKFKKWYRTKIKWQDNMFWRAKGHIRHIQLYQAIMYMGKYI